MTARTQTTMLRPGMPPMPPRMGRLPVDARGFPVPFFVPWVGENGERMPEGQGTPRFQNFDPLKFVACVERKLCWVCGHPLGVHIVFVLGPMCGINRSTSEPPCHRDCAEFSARACPFLTRPKMGRIDSEETAANSAGIAITRNPGVTLLWSTRNYRAFRAPGDRAGNEGIMFRVGDPEWVAWYREGRTATIDEVRESIDRGMPALLAMAEAQGPAATAALTKMWDAFLPLLPPEQAT